MPDAVVMAEVWVVSVCVCSRARDSDRKIKEVLFCEDSVKGNGKLLGFLKARSFVYDYILNVVPGSEIEKYAVGNSHGGLIMLCGKRNYPDRISDPVKDGFYIYLEGI